MRPPLLMEWPLIPLQRQPGTSNISLWAPYCLTHVLFAARLGPAPFLPDRQQLLLR